MKSDDYDKIQPLYSELKRKIIQCLREEFNISVRYSKTLKERMEDGTDDTPTQLIVRGKPVKFFRENQLFQKLILGSVEEMQDLIDKHEKLKEMVHHMLLDSQLRELLQREAESRGQYNIEKGFHLIQMLNSGSIETKSELLELLESPGDMQSTLELFFEKTYGKKLKLDLMRENNVETKQEESLRNAA